MAQMIIPADPQYVIQDFRPVYLTSFSQTGLQERVEWALEELRDCCACPRDCHVNRLDDETGVCLTGRHAYVASAFPHFGEEDCLRGVRGSGTIFFAACNLRCVFCQNWDISQTTAGQALRPEQLAGVMLDLQGMKCHNINFVTPEHVVPQIVEALAEAIPNGLRLPLVYNTSAYDSLQSLRIMDGLVDIYMPGLKFWTTQSAQRYAKARDYPERAKAAIKEMHRQVGPLRFGPDGLVRRGVLIRHLVMPGQLDETEAILAWIAEELGPETYVNIMAQYRPEHRVGQPNRRDEIQFMEIDRCPTNVELDQALQLARDCGLVRIDERWL